MMSLNHNNLLIIIFLHLLVSSSFLSSITIAAAAAATDAYNNNKNNNNVVLSRSRSRGSSKNSHSSNRRYNTQHTHFQKDCPNVCVNNNNALLCGLKNAIASGLGTAVSKTLLAPFDTLKTVQQQDKGEYLSLIQAYHKVTRRSHQNSIMNTCNANIGSNGMSMNMSIKGLLDLYAGLGVSVIGSMPSVGLYFGVYAYCKRTITPMLQERYDKGDSVAIKTLGVAISAAIGNTVASFSRVPYEVVKQKLQTGMYPSTMVALRSMWSDSGMRSFFPLGGISSQMVRDIPYAIFTLISYEMLREYWVEKVQIEKNGGKPSAWRNMVAGAVAGGIGSFLTNPMDVVKTRLQTDVGVYSGVIDCATSTYAKEGASAFLKGVSPRLMHKVPANAFFFVSFELFRRLLNVDQVSVSEQTISNLDQVYSSKEKSTELIHKR